jgi:hypothetical protein
VTWRRLLIDFAVGALGGAAVLAAAVAAVHGIARIQQAIEEQR